MSTRRRFLLTTSAAVSWLATRRLFAQAADRLGMPVFSNGALGAYQQPGLLTRERFATLVGNSFHVFLNDRRAVDLTLQQVVDLTAQSKAAARQQALPAGTAASHLRGVFAPATQSTNAFLLQFSSPEPIAQDTYTLDHGQLGSFAVLLVSGGQKTAPYTCSATFNQLA